MSAPAAVSGAATPRGRLRRQQILDAAAELVAAKGFHAVGVAEIGAAAGVTGPAIYRHFANKQELLVALLEQVVDQLLDGARAVLRRTHDPDQALDALDPRPRRLRPARPVDHRRLRPGGHQPSGR